MPEFGKSSELTQKMMSKRKSNGIMMLETRSMPFLTPRLTTQKLMALNNTVHRMQRSPSPVKPLNICEYSCGVWLLRPPPMARNRYSMTHPHTTL